MSRSNTLDIDFFFFKLPQIATLCWINLPNSRVTLISSFAFMYTHMGIWGQVMLDLVIFLYSKVFEGKQGRYSSCRQGVLPERGLFSAILTWFTAAVPTLYKLPLL